MDSQGAIRHASYAIFIGLVCLGVFLQMLGAPVSFWSLEGSQDDFVSTLLMDLTVPSIASSYAPPLLSTVFYNFLHEHTPFRPPLLIL